jgi:hypothetical protein
MIKTVECMPISQEENFKIQLDNLNTQNEYLKMLNETHDKLDKLRERDVVSFALAGGVSALVEIEIKIIEAKKSVKWAEETVDKYQ